MKWSLVATMTALLVAVTSAAQSPQSPPPPEFEVVSIKRNTSGEAGGGMRTLPDGTMMMTNQPIRSIIRGAAPVILTGDWRRIELIRAGSDSVSQLSITNRKSVINNDSKITNHQSGIDD